MYIIVIRYDVHNKKKGIILIFCNCKLKTLEWRDLCLQITQTLKSLILSMNHFHEQDLDDYRRLNINNLYVIDVNRNERCRNKKNERIKEE